MKYKRATQQYRKRDVRLNDWEEVHDHPTVRQGLRVQAAR